MDHALRRSHLAARLPELEVDALLVTRLPNVRYLTGFTGSNGQVLLSADRSTFFTDFRYEEQSGAEVQDLDRRIARPELMPLVAEACREAGISRLGFEAAGITYRTYERLSKLEGIDPLPVGEEVERLRWRKDAEELGRIEEAQRLTDEAFDRVTHKLVEGLTERRAALELEHAMREAGAERLSFEPIVAFGENAAEPHHAPKDRALRAGDVVKMDFGCVADGYCSDMTRTVAFGEPAPQLREIHDLVRRAHEAGRDALRPGAICGEVDEAARSVIREAGHGDRFGHSLGHGVGLEVHEGPSLRVGGEDVVPEGAVITIEPGVYVPGVGGVRIEDMVVVTADGARPLPTSTHDLLVL